MAQRKITNSRKTNETNIKISLKIDGNGNSNVNTGNEMFDHMLSQLSKHGLIDLEIDLISGDSGLGWHHVVEDVGILLGESFSKCIGDGKGLREQAMLMFP